MTTTTSDLPIVDINGIEAKMTVTVTDPLETFNMLTNRLHCEGTILRGLMLEHYNGYGHAFDSLPSGFSEADLEDYRKSYTRYQDSANRQGIALDFMIERQGITKELVEALHTYYRHAERSESKGSVGRAAEQHRVDDWIDVVKAYQDNTAAVEAAQGDEATDAASNVLHETLGKLMRTRAPNLDALREKVRIARAELGDTTYNVFTGLLADIDRLN